jgi:hypothetical protein
MTRQLDARGIWRAPDACARALDGITPSAGVDPSTVATLDQIRDAGRVMGATAWFFLRPRSGDLRALAPSDREHHDLGQATSSPAITLVVGERAC